MPSEPRTWLLLVVTTVLTFLFLNPSPIFGTFLIPPIVRGLNNQRMRMVQDITIAILFNISIELPSYIYTRKNCNFSDVSCSVDFIKAPLWDVFDKERTLSRLRMLGVKIVPSVENHNKTRLFAGEWPFAVTQLLKRTSSIQERCQQNSTFCVLGANTCCIRLVPNTKNSVRILKEVNRAFRSGWNFKVEAAKVISAFKKKTQQQLVVTMHWRLDEDFVRSQHHHLSPESYCKEMMKVLNFADVISNQRDQTTSSNTTFHILVLGAFDVTKVKTFFLDVCGKKTRARTYEFHSKETLIPRSESSILQDERTDVKGQLDFELGSLSDIFLGSPFSSFSVLIAFRRFGSLDYNPDRTIMPKMDTKDHLALFFLSQFPYTHALAENKKKCSILKMHPRFRSKLEQCIAEEEASYSSHI